MKYRFRATRALTRDLPLARLHHHATYAVHPPASPHGVFWRSFGKLSVQQQRNAREAFFIFKQNPFHPRLRSHKIHKLSARYARAILCSGNRSRFARSLLHRRRCGHDGGHWFARSLSQIVSEGRAGVDSALPPTIAPDLQARLHNHAP